LYARKKCRRISEGGKSGCVLFPFSFSGITKERLACLPVAVDKRNHKLSKTPFLSFFAEVLMVEVIGTRDDGGV
jgi:hypothetical protein